MLVRGDCDKIKEKGDLDDAAMWWFFYACLRFKKDDCGEADGDESGVGGVAPISSPGIVVKNDCGKSVDVDSADGIVGLFILSARMEKDCSEED